MEISRNLFSFFLEKGVVIPSQGRVKGSLVRVDDKTAADIESGAILCVILGRMGHADKLQQVDTKVNNPLTRLQNWNLITPVLKRYNVEVAQDQKSLLIAADTPALLSLYEDAVERFKRRQVSEKAAQNNAQATADRTGKYNVALSPRGSQARTMGLGSFGSLRIKDNMIESVDAAPDRALGKCESLIEVLLTSMVQKLHIRTPQAAALLTTNKRYLSHILIHGVKGSYDTIRSWFTSLIDFDDNFTILLLQDIKGGQTALNRRHGVGQDQGSILILAVLTSLQPGILSHDVEVARSACKLLTTIGNALALTKHGGLGWDWFTSEGPESGLLSAIACLKRHLNSKEWVTGIIDAYGRQKMSELFNTHLRSAMPSPLSYMSLVHDIIRPLALNRGSAEALAQSGVVNQLLSLGIRSADPQMSSDLRGTALAFITEVWLLMPQAVEVGARKDLPKTILSLLKKGARDPSLTLQIGALTCLFHLLDGFSHSEHSYAPYIYKTLIFALIENHANEVAREFIISNIIFTLEAMPHVPVGVIVPPIVKQAALYGYNNHDFDFFITLAKHPRLTLRHGLLLVDLIGKICLNDPLFGRVATVPFLILAKKFTEDDAMQEYMERFAKVALSMFMHIESKQLNESQTSTMDPAHIRRTLIIETLAKLVSLRGDEFNARLLPLLKVVDAQYAKINNGRRHRNIVALRRMCGGEEGVEIEAEPTVDSVSYSPSSKSPRSTVEGASLDAVDEEYYSDEDDDLSEDDEFFDDEIHEDAEYQEALRGERIEYDQVRVLFEIIDKDKDGIIHKRELIHAATMDDEAMEIIRTNDRLVHLLEPKHFNETFKALDIEHTGQISLTEFQQFAVHLHKHSIRRKIKKRRRQRDQKREENRPDSRASSVFDVLEDEDHELSSPEENEPEEEEELKVVKKPKKKRNPEDDMTREEKMALARKKAKERQSNVQIGQRKVKVKVKKAAKSVQGDIDMAKKRLEEFRKRQQMEEERKRLKSREQRKKMRKEFLLRQGNRRAARRKEKEEKKFGVKSQMLMYGRCNKDSLHEGTFEERQKNSLMSSLHYAEEFKDIRQKQVDWLQESQSLFKKWLAPLRRVFRNYSRDFIPQRTNVSDFDELQKLQSGLTVSDWMIFVSDFALVPWMTDKTGALGIFHYSNVNLGADSNGLGAKRGAQIITFEEFVSCLRGISMGEGFRSLPTGKEKIDALGSYMRRKAYVKGENNKVLSRRMGDARVWERGTPLVEYEYMVPRSLGLKDSLCVGLEMVDVIVAKAIQRHILTLTKIQLERTDLEALKEKAWEPQEIVPLTKQMEALYSSGKPKELPSPKPKSKMGFGSGFTPTKSKPSEKLKHTPLKFGEASIQKLPLNRLKAARASVEVIKDLIVDVLNGTAKDRLLEVYEKPAKNNAQGWIQAVKKKGMEDKFARFRKKPKPLFQPRRRQVTVGGKPVKEPYAYRKLEEEKARKKEVRRKTALRKKRQQELKDMLEVQRQAFEQKKALDAEKERQARLAAKRKEADARRALIEETKLKKEEVAKWYSEGGKRGGGKKMTHEEMAKAEVEEAKRKRANAKKAARLKKFKEEKLQAEARSKEESMKKKAEEEAKAKEAAAIASKKKAEDLEKKRQADEEAKKEAAGAKSEKVEETPPPAKEEPAAPPAEAPPAATE
jgi:Ca2+-binding EF-hand superfamily protein